jgi:hypothetical protein
LQKGFGGTVGEFYAAFNIKDENAKIEQVDCRHHVSMNFRADIRALVRFNPRAGWVSASHQYSHLGAS